MFHNIESYSYRENCLADFSREVEQTAIYCRCSSDFETFFLQVRNSRKKFEESLKALSLLVIKLNEYFKLIRSQQTHPPVFNPHLSQFYDFESSFLEAHQKCLQSYTFYITRYLSLNVVDNEEEINHAIASIDDLIESKKNPYSHKYAQRIETLQKQLRTDKLCQKAVGISQVILGSSMLLAGCLGLMTGLIICFLSLGHASISIPILLLGAAIMLGAHALCKVGEAIQNNGSTRLNKANIDLNIPFFKPGSLVTATCKSVSRSVIVPTAFRLG
jgi:hypothetical protein